MTTTTLSATDQRDALVARLFQGAIATMELAAVYLGNQLGLYQALTTGPATSAELAVRARVDERYAREWLEQQATAGILAVMERDRPAQERRYWLPAGHAEALVDRDNPNYLSGLVRLAIGVLGPLPQLQQAFRTGAGIPYPAYGVDTREGIAEMNRPMFLHQLGAEWLPAAPALHARLQRPARVADIGCGVGWSSIALARAYPAITVDGYDEDAASIASARANALAAGVADRVHFQQHDASRPMPTGYDAVFAFECIHDMARPVEALRMMRAMAHADGWVVVADERVGETFTGAGDDIERLNYGFSVLHCLPVSRADTPSAATGTVIRPPTMRAYAAAAGYQRVDELPIANDFWRFYRLVA